MDPSTGITHRRQEASESGSSNSAESKENQRRVNILLQKENPPIRRTLSQLLYIVAVALIFLWVLQSNFGFASSHSHSHDHDHHGHSHDEPASYKYSRQANEKLVVEQAKTNHIHDDHHGHSHDESPSHKYSRQANEKLVAEQEKTNHINDQRKHAEKIMNAPPHNPDLLKDAILSTLIISSAPLLTLIIMPSKEKQNVLKILLSFASGGLLGDALLHLIPQTTMAQDGDGHSHSHSHSHSHGGGSDDDEHHAHDISVGMWVLVGIITFLIVEKLIRILRSGNGHSHNHNVAKKGGKGKAQKTDSNSEEMNVAGFLNLVADFTHKFIVGLAIGTSYLGGRSVGIATTCSILLHQVLHEIGDFAILIQSGCSKKKAVLFQLIAALGAFAGTMVSLMTQGVGDAIIAWIRPFAAGGFIYIATVSVIPDLLQETTLKQSLMEIIALLTGVYMMFVIAQFNL